MQIDKNVPIPKSGANKQNSKHRHLNKIIEAWEVGDSVAFEFVAKTTGAKRPSYSLEATSLRGKAEAAGQKVSTRVMADEGVIRVWRVE